MALVKSMMSVLFCAKIGSSKQKNHDDPITPDPSIPSTTNSLRRIPPEIRQKIFYFSGVSKETLAALVGDQALYEEGLKVYWETTRFDIKYNWRTTQRFLSQKSLNSIKKIRISTYYDEPFQFTVNDEERAYKPGMVRMYLNNPVDDPKPNEIARMYDLVDSLKPIDIRIKFENTLPRHRLQRPQIGPLYLTLDRVRNCFAAFYGTSPGIHTFSCEFDPEESAHLFDAIGPLNGLLGINANLIHEVCLCKKTRHLWRFWVPNSFSISGPVLYFWENQDGSNLEWGRKNPDVLERWLGHMVSLEWSGFFRGDRSQVSG